MLAVDFVRVDTMLLKRIYALIAVKHGSRRAHLVGVTAHPTGEWATQAARNLMMDLAARATSVKFLLRDRDFRFTRSFDAVFAADSIQILISPPGAPRANAICERLIGTLRRELLDRMLIVNERHLSPDPHDLSASFQHHGTTSDARATRTAPGRNRISARDQHGWLLGSPQTDPRWTHQRVSHCRMIK